jgi:acetylornithine deacetylase/succinyl-diaminopimelate desuccinylase-like protein
MSASVRQAHDPETIRGDPDLGEAQLIQTLRTLVGTQSVNPGVFEARMVEAVRELLAPTECEIELVESLPGRWSLVALVRCRTGGPRVVLNGHMDTVGIDDPQAWSSDPFVADVRDGFLYGRGSCDMKAGLTTQIAVGRYVAKHRAELRGQLVLHFAVGEERGEPGTASLVAAGYGGDVGIVTEPSELNVAVAQRGLAFYDIAIPGRSVHASRPELGVNPILRVPEVLSLLEAHRRSVAGRTHPLLPPPTCTPTMVRAGAQPNSLADDCVVTVDRRLLPGETPEAELDALRARLAEVPDVRVELRPNSFRPAEVSSDSRLAAALLASTKLMTGRAVSLCGAPYATDCNVLVHEGKMEAVVFGPGNPAECHCPDERVSLSDLRDAALALAKCTVDYLD